MRHGFWVVLWTALATFAAKADVVGADDRIEVRHSSEKIRTLGKSIAVHTTRSKLVELPGKDSYLFVRSTASREHGFCDDMRFAEQEVNGECTATLIGPDEVLLAAHCITEQPAESPFDLRPRCETSAFLFDFRQKDDGSEPGAPAKTDVYFCRSIQRFLTEPAPEKKTLKDDGKRLDDYVFVKLDREVKGHVPLRLSEDEMEEARLLQSANGERVVLHHPHGLVQKVSPVSNLQLTSSNVVRASIDVSHGSSGAPIVDVETGTVLAILKGVTYPNDYKDSTRDKEKACRREFVFPESERAAISVRAHLGIQLRDKKVKPRLTQ